MSVLSLGILYVHIPKTGGSSVAQWMIKNTPVTEHFKMNHPNIGTLRASCDGRVDHAFTVVRNPWARAVSFYTYHKKRFETGISTVDGYTDFPSFDDFIFNYIDGDLNDKSYAVNGRQVNLDYWFRMSTPQVDWIDDSVDTILRTESLDSDFKTVQDMFGCYAPLGMVRQSSTDDYKTYYTTDTKNKVTTYYQKDIDTFKYTF